MYAQVQFLHQVWYAIGSIADVTQAIRLKNDIQQFFEASVQFVIAEADWVSS